MTKPNPQEPGSAWTGDLVAHAFDDGLIRDMNSDIVASVSSFEQRNAIVERCNAYPALARKLEEARSALEWYAHLDNHIAADGPPDDIGQSRMWQDKGDRARRALAQMEQG